MTETGVMAPRTLSLFIQGYVYGSGDHWEAICLNLDIAAQGESLEETKNLLFEMIAEYISLAEEMPAPERERMLNRSAPFLTRLGYHLGYFLASVFGRNNQRDRIGFLQHVRGSQVHCPV